MLRGSDTMFLFFSFHDAALWRLPMLNLGMCVIASLPRVDTDKNKQFSKCQKKDMGM